MRANTFGSVCAHVSVHSSKSTEGQRDTKTEKQRSKYPNMRKPFVPANDFVHFAVSKIAKVDHRILEGIKIRRKPLAHHALERLKQTKIKKKKIEQQKKKIKKKIEQL